MNTDTERKYTSHGDGCFCKDDFQELGENVIFENGILVFHPENICIGANVYIGHQVILKGYYKNKMSIGKNSWIGQGCFFHSAGNITIGEAVGIGPFVRILTSVHTDGKIELPVLFHELEFKEVKIKDGADIGVGSIILPGVTIGEGAIVGAGSVVTRDVPDYAIVAGSPAHFLRSRKDIEPKSEQ